jgi:hypothetical protein
MRSVRPKAATISVLDAKIVTIRWGGAGSVTTRSSPSRTTVGSPAVAMSGARAHAAATIAGQQARITTVLAGRR